jgi:hypothetical protein
LACSYKTHVFRGVNCSKHAGSFLFLPTPSNVPYGLRGLPSRLWFVAELKPTSEAGTPVRRSYVVPMRWMVIHEYEVQGGALNLNSTNYQDHGHHGDLPL